MSRKKITFGPELNFDEWLEPGYTGPHQVVRKTSVEGDRRIFYQSFGSGSSGNSCYIGTSKGGLLIDGGVRDDAVVDMLKSNGVSMDSVKGIVITHDHTDHVKYVYKLLRNHKHIKLFCTNRVLNGMLRRHNVSSRVKDYHIPIFKEIPFEVGDFEITAFEVPHDGTDNMGFSLRYGDRRFVLATDMGEVSARARHYIGEANYLVIEANYDLKMLREGSYPEYLKARIETDHGHMDNTHTAQFLAEIIRPELEYIFLCHLSKENNTPQKALETVREALTGVGKRVGAGENTLEDRSADIQLVALPRLEPSRWYVFV